MPAAELGLQFVGHATVLLEVGGLRILTDPFLRQRLGPLERHGPLPDPADLGRIDIVLVSHAHPDHFDAASLLALHGRPTVVVPRGLGAAARRATGGAVVELVAGERWRTADLAIEAVPARHWVAPGGPRAAPIGYVIDTGQRTWFAGDTGRYPAMRSLAGTLDVVLLPVWTWGPHLGPGHLGPRSAAEVAADVRAPVAVPIHWGTLYPRRLHRLWSGPLDEPGERFAAHVGRLSPTTDVRMLRPGERNRVERPQRR